VVLARSPHNASLRHDPEGGCVVGLPGAPGRPYGNLPSELTSFIGRERETAEVKRGLGDFRLLTLTGPGGRERPDGAIRWWRVELVPVSDPALVPRAVASILGVHEQVDRSMGDLLRDRLESRRLLLILDNCEHLIGARATLANVLLRPCPDLRILATSREAKGIAGENVVLLPSLSLPDPQTAPEDLPRGKPRCSGSWPQRSAGGRATLHQPPHRTRPPALRLPETGRNHQDGSHPLRPRKQSPLMFQLEWGQPYFTIWSGFRRERIWVRRGNSSRYNLW